MRLLLITATHVSIIDNGVFKAQFEHQGLTQEDLDELFIMTVESKA